MELGNSIGNFIIVEEATLMSNDRRMPRILAEFDMAERLLENIEVRLDEGTFIQRLDC